MIFRIQRDTNFTNINNAIFEDNCLSLPAIGLLCYLLSKPKKWEIIPRVLCQKLNKKANSKAGYEYILDIIKELESNHYIHKKRKHDGTMEYFVLDEPNPDFTYSEKTLLGKKPISEKPNRENNDTYKEKNIHKEKTIEKKEKKSPNSSKEDLNDTDLFLEFWEIYPRKEARKEALKIFIKLSKTKQHRIIKLTSLFKADMEENGRTRKHILLPSTYLNQERYEDYTENLELSKTNEGADFKGNKGESRADILSEKIINIIKTYENEGDEENFETKAYFINDVFDEVELDVLKHLDYSFKNFKDMEFKAGEIKRYLRGVFDG